MASSAFTRGLERDKVVTRSSSRSRGATEARGGLATEGAAVAVSVAAGHAAEVGAEGARSSTLMNADAPKAASIMGGGTLVPQGGVPSLQQPDAVVAARVDASTQSAGQRGAALAAEQQQQSSSPKYLVGISHYRPRHFHSTSCGTAAAAVVLGSSGAAAAAAEAASVAVSSRARTRVDQNPCLLQLLLFCLSKVIAVLVHRVHEQPTVMLMAVAMHFCDCLQTDHFGCREGLS
ncbi:hypothetical protein JKP88DRAFT_266724 [Tribonema minus]|uniref:Uncharacterized protein n=1 Tax=Tribonema minus TaxID=303371 RepID=A0A836CPH9_9STRA|nr:hypothetical protein JKP88DRAFT_266724 [Tribonema minus]